MLHPTYHIADSVSELSLQTEKDLLLQVGADFLGLAVFSPETKKVYSWTLFHTGSPLGQALQHEDLSTIKEQLSWLQGTFRKILFVDYTSNNSLIPLHLGLDEEKELLLKWTLGNVQDAVMMKDLIAAKDISNYYTIPASVVHVLNQLFPSGCWWQVQSFLMAKEVADEPTLTVDIFFNEILIGVSNKGSWLLQNKFSYKAPEDVLYHILNCIRQLNLQNEETEVIIQGLVDEQSALARLLNQYLHKPIWKQNLSFNFPNGETELPNHILALTDRLLTCVS